MKVPDKIVLYPQYMSKVHDQDDIALVHTSETFKFDFSIMPICLPFGDKFPDNAGEVGVLSEVNRVLAMLAT